MDMEKITSDFLGEEYYKINHKSGLTVYVMPKKNIKSCYAVFGTDFGSVDTSFCVGGETVNVPEGTAHFLEHKLFESEEIGAFELYAKTGASANAYTSFDKTAYLFSCTDNFDESLRILLEFVTHPYFTQETVEKEQGIIGQEIRMYQDNPDWQVLFNLLRALYHNNPVRIDLAGTKETIAKISADTLYKCYETFYNPSNMVLCVAGNVTPGQVMSIVDEKVRKRETAAIIRNTPEEPGNIVKDYVEQDMHSGIIKFSLGFREKVSPEPLRAAVMMAVAFELICGRMTEFYEELISQKLINSSFGTEYFRGRGFAVNVFSGESGNPVELKEKLFERIRLIKENGVDEELFEAVKRKKYGTRVRCFDDPDSIAEMMLAAHFEKTGIFEVSDIYRRITKEDVENMIKESFDESLCALSVIK